MNQVTKNLEKDVQIPSNLLKATGGGELELTKFFYHKLSWEFNMFSEPIPFMIEEQQEDTNAITVCHNSTNQPREIKQKEISPSLCLLGVWKTIIGDDSDHLSVLTNKITEWHII